VHQGLADALAALGRADEAEAEYRTALRLKPNYPAARYNLALLLSNQNRLDEAAALYAQTLRLDPSHYKSHYNLAQILLHQSRAEEALAHLHAVLQLRPELLEARIALADLLAAQGHAADAASHYRAALRTDPASTAAANNLAWLLATTDDPQVRAPAEAAKLAERAVAALPGEPTLLDTLGVAYAAAGRFDEAIATVQRAIDLAAADPELRAEMQTRLELYQSRQAYRK
jgi:Flp pilus assembly protein TadD